MKKAQQRICRQVFANAIDGNRFFKTSLEGHKIQGRYLCSLPASSNISRMRVYV